MSGGRCQIEYRAEPYSRDCPDEQTVLTLDTLAVRIKHGDFEWSDDRHGPNNCDARKTMRRIRSRVLDGIYVETPVFPEGMA